MFDAKIVWLYTDCVVWLLVVLLGFYVWHVRRQEALRAKWQRVIANPTAATCAALLALFFVVAGAPGSSRCGAFLLHYDGVALRRGGGASYRRAGAQLFGTFCLPRI